MRPQERYILDDTENTPIDSEVTGDEAQSEQVDSTDEESNAPTASPVDTEEKLLAGKYKNPEELEKGYLELQSQFTKTRQADKEPVEEEVIPYRPPTPPEDPLVQLANEDGSIDPLKLIQYTKEQAKEEIRHEQRATEFERDDWNKAVKEFPMLADNPKLAEFVRNNRLNQIVTGRGYRSYSSVAKDIIGEITKSTQAGEEKGRNDAQVTEKIVARAGMVEPSNTKEPSGDEREKTELEQMMKSPDYGIAQRARQQYLSKYM